MSFTNVDIKFSEPRFAFDAPDFGSLESHETHIADVSYRGDSCATCGMSGSDVFCIACADLSFIVEAIPEVLRNGDRPGPDGDDEQDEEQDGDTESERAPVSTPGY
jgi:hypothetical protein